MVTVPADTPVTEPDALLTLPIAVLLLLQLPPVVAHVSVTEEPAITDDKPEIPAGDTFTDIVVVLKQAEPNRYVITALPEATPVTIPVVLPTEALAVLLLLHVPPVSVFDKVTVLPVQTEDAPVIAGTALLTVMLYVREQPSAFV
jgi:hypothetical protein